MWWPFKKAKYCKWCGQLKNWTIVSITYDENTGKQKIYREWKCLDNSHSNSTSDWP